MTDNNVSIAHVLKSHELRIRKMESNVSILNATESNTSLNISNTDVKTDVTEYLSQMKILKTHCTELTKTNINLSTETSSLRNLVNSQEERIRNVSDLLILVQKEFLTFKQDIEEKNKVKLVITELTEEQLKKEQEKVQLKKEQEKKDLTGLVNNWITTVDVEADEESDEEADEESDVEADEEADEESDEESDVEADEESDVEADEESDEESDEEADEEADSDEENDPNHFYSL